MELSIHARGAKPEEVQDLIDLVRGDFTVVSSISTPINSSVHYIYLKLETPDANT